MSDLPKGVPTALRILSLALFLGGCVLVALFAHWAAMVGVVAIIWGDNISEKWGPTWWSTP